MSRDNQEINISFDMDKIKNFILSRQTVTSCCIEFQYNYNEKFKQDLIDNFNYAPSQLIGKEYYTIETLGELYDYKEDVEEYIEENRENIDYVSLFYEGEEEIDVIWTNENML